MNFLDSVSVCFKKYFIVKGRASRSEFWWFQLIWVVSYLFAILSNNNAISYFFFGILIIIAIPLITVGIRRLHDTNKSGFYFFFNFIPFIGALIYLAMMLPEGTKGKNKFGANPLIKIKKKRK